MTHLGGVPAGVRTLVGVWPKARLRAPLWAPLMGTESQGRQGRWPKARLRAHKGRPYNAFCGTPADVREPRV